MERLAQVRREGRRLFQAVVLFSIFVNLLMLTGPLFMLQVYDRVLGSGSEETLLALFLLVGALYILMAILDYARGRVLARYGTQFQDKLDPEVFDISLKEAIDPKARTAPATGLRDLETLQQLFTSPALLALCDIPWTPLFIALIFVFHPWLGWLALFGGAALITITLVNHSLSRKKTLHAQSLAISASSFAEDARAQAELVKAQGFGKAMLRRWLAMRGKAVDETLGANDVTGLFSTGTKSFRLFLQSAMLGLGAYLVLQGQMTAGAMIAGSILLGRALAPVEQGIGSWPLVQKSMSGWQNLAKILQANEGVQPKASLPLPEAHIELRNVTLMAKGRAAPVLSNVNLRISPGEAVGAIGKSGAGKSSLARLILGLSTPQAGEVMVGNAHIQQYDDATLGAAIGYLPQSMHLFPATIAQNIARMEEEPELDAVIKAAKLAKVHDLITDLPDGYNTRLGRFDAVLSGGQVQRIGLARALYSDPNILILDEPNSALDSEGTEALNASIRNFKQSGKAVLLMTHRPMAIAECDRLIVIDQGRIKADGPRDEILQSMVKNSDQVRQAFGSGARK